MDKLLSGPMPRLAWPYNKNLYQEAFFIFSTLVVTGKDVFSGVRHNGGVPGQG
jgi:hypothetical protein